MSKNIEIQSALIGDTDEWERLMSISAEIDLPYCFSWQQAETPPPRCVTLISVHHPQVWELLGQYATRSSLILLLHEKNDVAFERAMGMGCQDCLSLSELTPDLLAHTLHTSQQRFAYHQKLHHNIQAQKTELEQLVYMTSRLSLSGNLDDLLKMMLISALEVVNGTKGILMIQRNSDPAEIYYQLHPAESIPATTLATLLQRGEPTSRHKLLCLFDTVSAESLQTEFFPVGIREEAHGFLVIAKSVALTEQEKQFLHTLLQLFANMVDRLLLITHLEKKSNELELANEQLKELDKIKGKFVSDVSHELRTPITALSLHLDLLERGRPDRRDYYIQVIRTEVEWLRQLVLDILKLSRFDLGRLQIAFVELDFNMIASRELAMYHDRVEMAGLELIFEKDDNLPLIWGEPTQLGDMFNHLLSNALAYTKKGFIRIKTDYDQESETLYFTVEDSGLGIAEEEQELIFGRFYRGANSHTIAGSGLGLNIVQEIVKLHLGKITLTSQVGMGSKFEITLPRVHPANQIPAQKAS